MGRNSRHPTLYDEVLKLDISSFKKKGYLVSDLTTTGIISWNSHDNKLLDLSFELRCYAASAEVYLSYGGNTESRIHIEFVKSNLGKGVIAYFVDPITSLRCRKLYFVGGVFGHRSLFKGCFYEVQTQSKNNRNLDELFAAEFLVDRAFREINRKHFKKYYKGKPTKKFRKWMILINKYDRKLFEYENVKMTKL